MFIRRLAIAFVSLGLVSGVVVFALIAFATPSAKEIMADGPQSVVRKGDGGPPADELIDEAERSAQKGNRKEAIGLLEEAVRSEPANRRGLLLLGFAYIVEARELDRPQNTPLYLKSAATLRKLRDSQKKLNREETLVLRLSLYQEAAAYAARGDLDKAFASLNEAIDAGFSDREKLMDDDELAPLRKSPRFAEITEKMAAKNREHLKELLAENQPFPIDFALPGLDGKIVKLADFRGKVTLVDLWGTWCPPCREEIPHFIDLYKKYHDKGLEIVGLNFERIEDPKEARDVIQTFVKENKVPYPCLIGDEKFLESVPDFEGFPTIILLDRSGTVRLKLTSYHTLEDLDFIVSTLLNEK